MCYVRGSAKDHGRNNRIEGRVEAGQKAVVIEDLISTGGSVVEVVEALREAGAEVLGIASIFSYGMQRGLERWQQRRSGTFPFRISTRCAKWPARKDISKRAISSACWPSAPILG